MQKEEPTPSADGDLRIAFVSSQLPRRCGIATFTRDLAEAMAGASDRVLPIAVALTDPGGQYEYPSIVRYEVRQGVKGDHVRAAEFINYSDVRLVSIQHEHGIFGGDDGSYVLDFLTALRVPAIATLHTVLKLPSDSQRSIVQAMATRCACLVVMSQVAADLLHSSYGIAREQVRIIPHGIPEMARREQGPLKKLFGVPGQPTLLTFGLLGPGKGIETVIRALPSVTARFPDVAYFVVGATHPTIARRHGEAYRTTLEREAERLGVRENVIFRDQFVSNTDLCSYLQAADIFISPYLNEAQVTSGALSYAMGAGAAVVSTPYWHAQELLANGNGRLFPFGDSPALADILIDLLDHPAKLEAMRSVAHQSTRPFVWSRVGKAYVELAVAVIERTAIKPRHRNTPLPSSLPELRLDHLLRMTDDTGLIQHATYSIPNRKTGYCVDDNARGLLVALEADRIASSNETRKLVNTYLGYLYHSQTGDGGFINFMGYDRVFEPGGGSSEDCVGRAVWALGNTIGMAVDDGHRALARDMFERALRRMRDLGLRGTASAILGLVSALTQPAPPSAARETLDLLVQKLVDRYERETRDDWRWFEPTLTYDNALIPLALFKAYSVTGERSQLRIARETLEFLERICFHEGQLSLIGNAGWHQRGGVKPVADEQAIDAAAFVLAFRGAYVATGDHHYLLRMRAAFAWFLGANRLNLPLYDSYTAGCRDGLGEAQANQNEGAESTVAFLISLLQMLELAGEGLEHAHPPLTVPS